MGVLWLLLPLVSIAQTDIEITGLVVDQTLSRVGHLFYEELIDGWQPSNAAGVITIYEKPDLVAGNMVSIVVNDETVFESRVGTRPSGIEEKAQTARSLLDIYLQQHKEAFRELEMY